MTPRSSFLAMLLVCFLARSCLRMQRSCAKAAGIVRDLPRKPRCRARSPRPGGLARRRCARSLKVFAWCRSCGTILLLASSRWALVESCDAVNPSAPRRDRAGAALLCEASVALTRGPREQSHSGDMVTVKRQPADGSRMSLHETNLPMEMAPPWANLCACGSCDRVRSKRIEPARTLAGIVTVTLGLT